MRCLMMLTVSLVCSIGCTEKTSKRDGTSSAVEDPAPQAKITPFKLFAVQQGEQTLVVSVDGDGRATQGDDRMIARVRSDGHWTEFRDRDPQEFTIDESGRILKDGQVQPNDSNLIRDDFIIQNHQTIRIDQDGFFRGPDGTNPHGFRVEDLHESNRRAALMAFWVHSPSAAPEPIQAITK